MTKVKNFSGRTIDEAEKKLDDFVDGLKSGELKSVSPMKLVTSGYYTISCEYREVE